MKSAISRVVVFAFVVCSVALQAGRSAAGELFVASYNVENLFDTQDDPKTNDDDFLPNGAKQWSTSRRDQKIANLAKVVKAMNGNLGPDVLGLSEIENRQVVEMLVAELSALGRDYRVVHADSPDERGIDCAIVYDANKLKLRIAQFLTVDLGTDQTRDIAGAEFSVDGVPKRLHVFMNHWPSKRSDQNGEKRSLAAATLLARLEMIMTVDPSADIVVLGDLNDGPQSGPVKDSLKATTTTPIAPPARLLVTSSAVASDPFPGTYFYQGEWEIIDHIIVSPGLLDDQAFRWKTDSTHNVAFDFQIFHPQNGSARPNRSYSGNSFHTTGISDHLPIACVLEF